MAFLQQLQDFQSDTALSQASTQASSIAESEQTFGSQEPRQFDPEEFEAFATAGQTGLEAAQFRQELEDDPFLQREIRRQRINTQFAQEEQAFEQQQQLQEPFGVPQQRVRQQFGQLPALEGVAAQQEENQLNLLFGEPQANLGNIDDIIGDFVVMQDVFVPEFSEFSVQLRRLETEFLNTQTSGLLADQKRAALDVILNNIRDIKLRQLVQTEEQIAFQAEQLGIDVLRPPDPLAEGATEVERIEAVLQLLGQRHQAAGNDELLQQQLQDEARVQETLLDAARQAELEEPAAAVIDSDEEQEEFLFVETQATQALNQQIDQIQFEIDTLDQSGQRRQGQNPQIRRQLIQAIDAANDELQEIINEARVEFEGERKEEEPQQQPAAAPLVIDPNIELRVRLGQQIQNLVERVDLGQTEIQRQIAPLIRRIETIDENLVAEQLIDHPFQIEAAINAHVVVPPVAVVGLGAQELDDQLERHLGQISERIGREQLTIQGVTRFAQANRLAEFQTEGFNGKIVSDIIRANLDGDGLGIIDQFRLDRELRSVFEIGLKAAISSDMPAVNLLGVISEIGRSLGGLDVDDQQAQERIKEATDRALFALVGLPYLESFAFAPLRLPRILGHAFSPDMDRLMEANLPIAEIQQIARTFAAELPQVLTQGFGDEPDTTNQLLQIRTYINDTVANRLLRDTIISDIDVRITTNQREAGTHIKTDPFLILPQSVTRSIRIRDDSKNGIGNFLQRKINQFDSDFDPQAQSTIQAANNFIRQLNEYSNAHGIRVPLDTIIPGTEDPEEEEDVVDKPFIIDEVTEDDGITDTQLRELLVSVRNMFRQGNVEFTFNPTVAVGPDGLETDTLIADLKKTLDTRTSASARDLRSIGDTKIGAITVSQLMDNRRRITIPPNATVNNIMILAYTLRKEAGTLSDTTGVLSIMITKMTDVRMIVSLIMGVMKRNMGKEFQLIWIPMNPIGGMHLGGALSMVRFGKTYKGGRLLKPSGIDFPDMLQHLANMPLVTFTRFM